MKPLLSILILICAMLYAPCAKAQTNEVQPPPAIILASSTNTTFWVANQVPFMLYYGTDTNGVSILVPPPEWMLHGEPKLETIRLKFYHTLMTNEIITIDFKTPRMYAFAGWEIIEE